MTRSVDVAIIGGGLVGNLLARQLRRHSPELSVALFERDTERTYKVGESTVEIAANYLSRRLGLSTYLYQEHLPKNGLRFFFDTEAKDAPLHEMSEIGLGGMPPYPSFQFDRARLEKDLLEMNEKDGVHVEIGGRVKDLDLGEGGAAHTFSVAGDTETEWKARWVVDGTGRAAMIAQLKGLRMPERDHRIASAWGRFSNITDIDDWSAPDWHARVNHTARGLSTNHFCYKGYWIWFIPLGQGLTSVGICAERDSWDKSYHEPEGMVANLRKHRAIDQLMENAELVDHGAFSQLAYRTKQFFSADRWAVLGEAAAFPDPFYSPGSDVIAVENDLTASLIAHDTKGEDIRERVKAYDDLMHFRYETILLLTHKQYCTMGSFELLRAKAFFDCACYYNLWFDSYAKDDHLNLKIVQRMLRRGDSVLTVMRNFRDLFSSAATTLLERGDYYRLNTGVGLHDAMDAFGPITNVGSKRSPVAIDRRTEEIFNRTAELVHGILDDGSKFEKRRFIEFAEPGAFDQARV